MSPLAATQRDRIMDWAIDQAGGGRAMFTFDQALEAWQHSLAYELLRLGHHPDRVPDLLGEYLPGDPLPTPEVSR